MTKLHLTKKVKKIITFILVLLGLLFIGKYFFCNDSVEEKALDIELNQQVKDANYSTTENRIEISEEELSQRVIYAEEYVENLSFANDITLVKKFASYERLFDFTSYDNCVTEFFTKKKISWLIEYKAILSIPFNSLEYFVNEETGNVAVNYNKEDIELLAVDITNVPTFSKEKRFYESFSNEDILAHLKKIKGEITTNFVTEENYKLAETSLLKFILGNAICNGNLDIIEINGIPVNLTDEISNEKILNELNNLENEMTETQMKIDQSILDYQSTLD